MEKLKKEMKDFEARKIVKRNKLLSQTSAMMREDRKTVETPQKVYYVSFSTGELVEVVECKDDRDLLDLGTF